MSSYLPYNNMVVNGVTVTTAEFVYGSGVLVETGDDISPVTTADNVIRRYRRAINRRSQNMLYGDHRTSLSSSAGLPTANNITLKLDSSTVAQFTGVVSVDYDNNTRTSTVKMLGTPTFS